jgi:hypothetical protein
MTPEEILEGILQIDGKVWIEGDTLRYLMRADKHFIWVPMLRDMKSEMMVLVARRERETAELEHLWNLQDERHPSSRRNGAGKVHNPLTANETLTWPTLPQS